MLLKKQSLKSNWFRNLIVILLILGVFFRFYNLERKVYWYDETMTSLRVSGNTQTELVQQVFNGRVISAENLLQQYQYPNREKDINDTLNALAGNPEHSPLYYLMARFWLQLFGNSITTIRTLSALISLLALPCAYWLCSELFGSTLISWIAVTLIAISPFHVLYAQEAREYSLWTVTILLSSAALLWAMRRKNPVSWGIYGITVALGLYTHPFSGFVCIGHGLYVLITEGFRWSKRLTAYLLASILGLLLFLPWLWTVVVNFPKFLANTDSVNHNRAGFLPVFWGLNLSRIFFDLNQGSSPLNPLLYLIAALVGYALYYLYRKAPQQAWILIITLIGVTGVALIGPDLILGGRRSSITRYAIPCYLGIQIAVAYLVTTKLTSSTLKPSIQKRWQYVAIALAFSGVLSLVVSSQLPIWWHKSHTKSRYNPQVARLINQAEQPLVISDEIPGRVLSLSHLLKPDVQLQLVVSPNIPEIPKNFKNVFLYRPSEALQQGVEREHKSQLQDAYKSWLWKL